MNSIIKVFMERDGLTLQEASDLLSEMQERVFSYGENPEEVLFQESLEPDYLYSLIGSEF